jgi:putative endonuclease
MSSLGAFGEAWTAGFLARHGYRVVARNVRYRPGEIDIIAWDADVLVFVEVKTRRSTAYGAPEESITARRYAHLASAIDHYLTDTGLEPEAYRIDVMSLIVDGSGRVVQHRLLRGVEPPTGR